MTSYRIRQKRGRVFALIPHLLARVYVKAHVKISHLSSSRAVDFFCVKAQQFKPHTCGVGPDSLRWLREGHSAVVG
jgi:hypothetical protein